MKQTGEEYRLKNRQRLHKFYERHEAKGKRRVSALISGAAYDLMMDAKAQTGASISDLVDKALLSTFTALEDQVPDVDNVSGEFLAAYGDPGPVTDDKADEHDALSKIAGDASALEALAGKADDIQCVDAADLVPVTDPGMDAQADQVTAQVDQKKAEIRERDLQILEIEKKYPGRKNAQQRVDALNESGVLLKGEAGQWTKINAKNALLNARKNLGVK